ASLDPKAVVDVVHADRVALASCEALDHLQRPFHECPDAAGAGEDERDTDDQDDRLEHGHLRPGLGVARVLGAAGAGLREVAHRNPPIAASWASERRASSKTSPIHAEPAMSQYGPYPLILLRR